MNRPFASRLRQCAFLRWLAAVVVSYGGALPAYAAEERPASDRPASRDVREAMPATGYTTIGHVETVAIHPGNIHVDAKIDTGARSSSLDAANIQPFSKDGKEWVRFVLRGNDNAARRIELPVERTVRIRRAGAPVQRRYVVNIGVCLGNYYKMAEVNLINREGLSYRMLIGRTFLMGKFVIDPGSQYLTRASCPDR
jgi:hypothetical protein